MEVRYNIKFKGGKLKTTDFRDLLNKSYEKDLKDSGDFKIDKSLSGQRAKVYRNDKTNQTVISHRGTQGLRDILTDALYFTTGYKSNRFKHAEKIQKEAENKYGTANTTTIGHSLGAVLAKQYGNKSKEILTFNRPIGLEDLKKKKNDNIVDVRTTNDPFSHLNKYSLKNGNEVSINSKSFHPIEEHRVKNLDQLDPNLELGKGFKKTKKTKL